MTQITRDVLSDKVEDHLLQAILSGRYPPGSRIVESRVARELGVSQAPVREALRDLEALGIVEITAFRGASVRSPSKAELLEAYGVRAELESYGARLALARLSDADLEPLQSLIDAMRRAATRGDTHEEALVDGEFHARLIEITGNRTLGRVWRYLVPVARTYITLAAPGVDAIAAADLHQPILDALRMRDPDLAVAAIRRHFEIAGSSFDAAFSESVGSATGSQGDGASVDGHPPMEPIAHVLARGGRGGAWHGRGGPSGEAGSRARDATGWRRDT